MHGVVNQDLRVVALHVVQVRGKEHTRVRAQDPDRRSGRPYPVQQRVAAIAGDLETSAYDGATATARVGVPCKRPLLSAVGASR